MNTLNDPPATVRETSPDESTWLGLNFAWELGYTIAIPAVVFGVGGAYLDKYLHSSPLFMLLGFVFALMITVIALTKKIKVILSRMPQDLPKKPNVEELKKSESEQLHEQFRPKAH